MGFLIYAQAQQRAFLLASDSAFYWSFKRCVDRQKEVNKQLDSLIDGYSAQVVNLKEFKRLSERRGHYMERVLDSAKIISLRGLIPMLNAGAQIMDTLNRQVRKMEAEEDAHLKFRLGQKERRERNISAWMLGFSVIALITIVASFLILRTQRYRLSKAEMNKMQLEAEVQKRTREISEANRELHERNIELKARNAELNNFTFISSHDMKEPLRKTQTFLKLILEEDADKLSEASKEYADRILVSIAQMAKLIDAILIYMKAARKKKKEPVDLNRVFE
jgi:signal transduction histidine kinase